MTFGVDAQGLGRVLAAVPQFIVVVDRDGIIRYINHVQQGFDSSEVVGSHARAVIAPESTLGADIPPEADVIVASNVTELRHAQEEADRLRQLVPLCAWCDRIRTGEDTWQAVEAYLEECTGSRVTHGVCSDCLETQLKEADESDGDAA